jgi:hypothetical protein
MTKIVLDTTQANDLEEMVRMNNLLVNFY